MTISQKLCGLILIPFGFWSCDSEVEPTPSYLHIAPFLFTANAGQGTSKQDLRDAWIYIGSRYAGAYELPAAIPVLAGDTSDVLIIPGYRLDGQITHSAQARLMNPFTTRLAFRPGQNTDVIPSSSYQEGLKFSFVEDFESGHFINVDRDGDQETKILLSTPEEAFEGNRAGVIQLSAAHPVLEAMYDIDEVIAKSGDPILLELHFKSDVPFSIGFIGNRGGLGEVRLIQADILPKENWTKIYFDFRDIINKADLLSLRLAVYARYQKENPKVSQKVFLDNIKVVHR